MSNFVNFDNSAIQLGYGERNLVFARPASLAALKDLLRDYLQLTCHHTDMRISWASRDHGVLELVDDAGVAGLWAWCKLELAVVRLPVSSGPVGPCLLWHAEGR